MQSNKNSKDTLHYDIKRSVCESSIFILRIITLAIITIGGGIAIFYIVQTDNNPSTQSDVIFAFYLTLLLVSLLITLLNQKVLCRRYLEEENLLEKIEKAENPASKKAQVSLRLLKLFTISIMALLVLKLGVTFSKNYTAAPKQESQTTKIITKENAIILAINALNPAMQITKETPVKTQLQDCHYTITFGDEIPEGTRGSYLAEVIIDAETGVVIRALVGS